MLALVLRGACMSLPHRVMMRVMALEMEMNSTVFILWVSLLACHAALRLSLLRLWFRFRSSRVVNAVSSTFLLLLFSRL